jgi:WD40 repeat protein
MVSVSNQQQQNNLLVASDSLPEDAVSIVVFHPDKNLNIFAVGSWDCTVRILEIVEDNFRTQGIGIGNITSSAYSRAPTKQLFLTKFDAPVIEIKWTFAKDGLLVVTGEGTVSLITINGMKVNKVLTCPSTIFASAIIIGNNHMIVTVSLDGYVRYWTTQGDTRPIKETRLEHAPLCADANPNFLLIGCSQSQIIYIKLCEPDNIYMASAGIEIIPSVMHLSPSTHDFLIGSIDGRVLVAEFTFSNDSKQMTVTRKIAFKAHKEEIERVGPKKLFHINSMTFPNFQACKTNIVHSSATEGIFKVWDLTKKETIQEMKYSSLFGQITASALSPNLRYAVVCCGYDWSQGVWGINRPNSKNSGDANAVCIVITALPIDKNGGGLQGL